MIVVLVILAILAAFMIPALIQYIERSLEASDIIEVRAGNAWCTMTAQRL